jgi:hypothetical protein
VFTHLLTDQTPSGVLGNSCRVSCSEDENGEAWSKVLSDQLFCSPLWENQIRFKAEQLTMIAHRLCTKNIQRSIRK